MKTILAIQIVQNAIENNKQLFFVVDNALLVNRVQVNHVIPLYKCLRVADGSRPVNLVVSPMQVLDGEQHEVPVLCMDIPRPECLLQSQS